MKIKFAMLSIAALMLTISSFSQESSPTRIHQAGIQFSSLNAFGLQYKTGKNNMLCRMSTLVIDLGSTNKYGRDQDSVEVKMKSAGIGIRGGFEKKVAITPEFDFLWGLEAGIAFNMVKSKNSNYYQYDEFKRSNVEPGLYAVLGFSWAIREKLILGAEITPGFWFSIGKETYSNKGEVYQENNVREVNLGFSSSAAAVSVAYRFGNK